MKVHTRHFRNWIAEVTVASLGWLLFCFVIAEAGGVGIARLLAIVGVSLVSAFSGFRAVHSMILDVTDTQATDGG